MPGGAARRRKGHDFERAVCRILTHRTRAPWKRGLQTRGGGEEVPDCFNEDLPFHIECKIGKAPGIRGALLQAEHEAGGRKPIAIVKHDREEPTVTMRMELFLEIFEDHIEWCRHRGIYPDPTGVDLSSASNPSSPSPASPDQGS